MKAKLDSMDKDALMQFVKDKGNARKKDLFEVTKFQTGDAENTKKLAMEIEAQIDLARDAKAKFDERISKYNEEKAEAEGSISGIQDKITATEGELAEANDDPTPFKNAANEALERIDKRMIEELNKILSRASPAPLVRALEALVGILRNVNQANNIDVELFLKDSTKLLTKFKRMESTGLTYAYVRKHKAELEAELDAFKIN